MKLQAGILPTVVVLASPHRPDARGWGLLEFLTPYGPIQGWQITPVRPRLAS